MSRQCKQDRKTTAPSLSGFILFSFQVVELDQRMFWRVVNCPDDDPKQCRFDFAANRIYSFYESSSSCVGAQIEVSRMQTSSSSSNSLKIFIDFPSSLHCSRSLESRMHSFHYCDIANKIISRAIHWNRQSTLLVVWSALFAFHFTQLNLFPFWIGSCRFFA